MSVPDLNDDAPDEGSLSAAERGAADALRALRPRTPAPAARDALFFQLGRRSATTRLAAWRAAAAVLALALGTSLLVRPATREPAHIADSGEKAPVGTPAAVEPAVDHDALAYLRLRDTVLDRGVDALPATPVAAAEPPTAFDRTIVR